MYFLGKYYKNLENINNLYNNLLYLSYKFDFENIKDTDISSDLGWGCTIRSTQMMLANVLLYKKFCLDIEKNEDYYYILYIFKDNYESEFSIYNFVKYYHNYKKKPGDWIGPFTSCSIIENFYTILNNKFDIIYLHNLCERKKIDSYYQKNKSYLLSFSIKLGINNIDKIYYNDIVYWIKNKYFKGIIGGKNDSSFYFIGITDDFKLLYLDPHKLTIHSNNIYNDSDYHTGEVLYLDLNQLSPSMSFCFYFENFDQLKEFYNSTKKNNILNIIDKNNIDTLTIEQDEEWEVIGI